MTESLTLKEQHIAESLTLKEGLMPDGYGEPPEVQTAGVLIKMA